MAISVRVARLPQDESAIFSFINGLQEHEAAFEPNRRLDTAFPAEHWREVQRRCAERNGVILIAEDEENPVGWAFAHDETGELFVVEAERIHGFLAELYVVPEARGKGFGRALIGGCEEWAREREHKLLMVGVLAKNPSAISSYKSAGYGSYALTMRRYL